jgi:ABC-type nitrate/sulfonate/bicarbonate transport system ATPase subunit
MQTIAKPRTDTIDGTTVESLSYSYKGMEVFKDLSFHAGTKTIILRGPSGCGKTTLLKLLSGNLEPSHVGKMPATDQSCLVLQEDSLFPWLTGTENIRILTKIKAAEFKKHPMYELIALFVEQKACRMSYGQRRLVELFRAIVFRPQYLYLDEPFNFLDEERIGLVLPFLQGEFMANTNLMLSNHHREDLASLGPSTLFRFDGLFPISQLRRES